MDDKWWLTWVMFDEYIVEGRWNVYRCYGRHGELLYVGLTSDLRRRFRIHKGVSPWYGRMVRVDIVEFLDEAAARHAERKAIWLEVPLYNRHGQSPSVDVSANSDGVG